MKQNNNNYIPYNVTKIILDSVSDGVFTVDKNWCITSFNRAAEKITGVSCKEAIGKQCCEVFRSNMCEKNCALRRTMKSGKPYVDSFAYIVNNEKRRIPVTVCTSILKDENGNIIGGVETFRDMSMVEELRRELDERYQMGDIIGRSKAIRKILKILPQIAVNNSTILIQGETGTGKELIAQAIHELSPRKDKPFKAINCGALPDTLLESELFGYKAGAFTDAKKDKPGLLALAEGGTVFLDEIGDVSAAFQVRLLRVLQERTFTPLGGTEPLKSNIRVIAASNKNIDQLVNIGTFRQDLFYRINVMRLEIPPLRERKEDIPLFITYFINKFNKIQNKTISGISRDVFKSLMYHEYPGNVRELENIIEHAFILCSKEQIELHCLPENVVLSSGYKPSQSIDDIKKSIEAKLIINALRRNNYNRLEAARDLGMHKSTLFRKIKLLSINLPKIDGRSKQKNFK